MASMQQIPDVARLNNKEEAAVKEAVKEAKAFLANNIHYEKANKTQLATVAGVMKNYQESKSIKLYGSHTWEGHFLDQPDDTIESKKSGSFVHEGTLKLGRHRVIVGSKAGVKYGQCDDNPKVGWLLAWYKPADSSTGDDKVYVEAGPLDDILNKDWAEIEQKLDASTGQKMHYLDPKTKAVAYAEIDDQDNNQAALGAAFYAL